MSPICPHATGITGLRGTSSRFCLTWHDQSIMQVICTYVFFGFSFFFFLYRPVNLQKLSLWSLKFPGGTGIARLHCTKRGQGQFNWKSFDKWSTDKLILLILYQHLSNSTYLFLKSSPWAIEMFYQYKYLIFLWSLYWLITFSTRHEMKFYCDFIINDRNIVKTILYNRNKQIQYDPLSQISEFQIGDQL